jgi:hypothetical protein
VAVNCQEGKTGNEVVFTMPLPSVDAKLPVCDIDHDLGVVVKAVFDRGSHANGKYYPIISEHITVPFNLTRLTSQARRIASDFTKGKMLLISILIPVTGVSARFDLIPKDEYINSVGPYIGKLAGLDLYDMFFSIAEFGYAAAEEPEALKNTADVRALGAVADG